MQMKFTSVSFLVLTLVLVQHDVANAQNSPARGWVDVNIGLAASGAEGQTYAWVGLLYSEPLTMASSYSRPSTAADLDFGAGYMFNPMVGAGLSFVGTAHKDRTALAIEVPHPYYSDSATIAESTTSLTRTESATNFQIMVAALDTPRTRFRFFAGPTYFQLKADMVQDIGYSQVASASSSTNVVTITGYNVAKGKGSGWGFHAGADVSYFFSRVAGVGAFGRVSRGTLTIDEPLSETAVDVRVGGLQIGAGLRLRF
jgi:hypothetical protein